MIDTVGGYLFVKCDLCKTNLCRFNDWAIGEGSIDKSHIFCDKCFERLMK